MSIICVPEGRKSSPKYQFRRDESADEQQRETAGNEAEAVLDEIPDRIAERPEQAADQEEARPPRHDARQHERAESRPVNR